MISAPPGETALVRAIGVRTLAASIVNTTVGAGIFVLPAAVAARIGAAAPVAYLICAVTMALIVTCFAMAGSRVAMTGGLYAYVEVAFGRFVGFLTGVLYWLSAVMSGAGVLSALAASVGLMIPPVATTPGRIVFLVAVCAGLAVANVRGVRTGGHLVEGATVAKLLPLALFVAVGLFFVKRSALAWPGLPASGPLGDTVLLLIFAFVGIEVALMPSGEVKDPARTVPRAIYIALATTTLLYMAVQFVAHGVLGAGLESVPDAPLAAAAERFLGRFGLILVLAGGTISMFGYASGDMLGTPRLSFAFGRDGLLPAAFGRVHPRYRTPAFAIGVHAVVICTLAVAGSFGQLAVMGNVAVLSLYLVCVIASWELARRRIRTEAEPFTLPGDALVPVLASAAILWILAHASAAEFAVEGAVLVVASGVYALGRKGISVAR